MSRDEVAAHLRADGGSEPGRFTTPDGKHTLLIIDDPVSVEPPTAEQLAARQRWLAEHIDAGVVVLPGLGLGPDRIGELLGEFEDIPLRATPRPMGGAWLRDASAPGFKGLSDAARLELHRMATVYGSGSVIVSEDGEVVDDLGAVVRREVERESAALTAELKAAILGPAPAETAEQAATDALTGALFTEAARRIVKQDDEAAALKKHRAKRKRLQKLAKKQRGKRG